MAAQRWLAWSKAERARPTLFLLRNIDDWGALWDWVGYWESGRLVTGVYSAGHHFLTTPVGVGGLPFSKTSFPRSPMSFFWPQKYSNISQNLHKTSGSRAPEVMFHARKLCQACHVCRIRSRMFSFPCRIIQRGVTKQGGTNATSRLLHAEMTRRPSLPGSRTCEHADRSNVSR